MHNSNVDLPIDIRHIAGTNSIDITADYWKNDGAQVKAIVEFNEANRLIGDGVYRYVKGETYVRDGHMGTYKIFNTQDGQLLVQYQHIYPRGQKYNPDENKGWQVWTKI